MDYLVSDLHLDHDNIIDYCDRQVSRLSGLRRTIPRSNHRREHPTGK